MANFKRRNNVLQRAWAPDERTSKKDEPEKRFSPPSRAQQDAAAYMCQLILDRYGVTNAEIATLGRKYITCRTCQANGIEKCSHLYKVTHCPVCGTHLPMAADFHSSVDYIEKGDMWLVILGRTVSQRNRPMDQVDNCTPYYGMDKKGKGEFWPMYVNLCYTLAPLVMAVAMDRNLNGVANWRAFNERRHVRWATMLVKQAHPILVKGGFVDAVRPKSGVTKPANVSTPKDQLEARRTTIKREVKPPALPPTPPSNNINDIVEEQAASYLSRVPDKMPTLDEIVEIVESIKGQAPRPPGM